ncbi:MAG TPA: Hsp20/alpha crystallin family protein [bacterium]|nr:Hsp20/alpha crystallin family protein [bacterium]
MTLVKYTPYRGIADLSETVDRLFGGLPADQEARISVWTPLVEVSETDAAYEVQAEIPGIEKKDISLSLENNVLTLKGEKKEAVRENGRHYHRSERSYGRFERAFRLPHSVKAGEITAKYENGILTVTVPKADEARPREIPVH